MDESEMIRAFYYARKQKAMVLITDLVHRPENIYGRGWTKKYGTVDLKANVIRESPRTDLRRFMWIEVVLELNARTMRPMVVKIEDFQEIWDVSESRNREGLFEITLNGRWSLPVGPKKHGPVRFYNDRYLGHVMVTENHWIGNEDSDLDVELVLMETPVRVGKKRCCFWYLRHAEQADDSDDDELQGYMR